MSASKYLTLAVVGVAGVLGVTVAPAAAHAERLDTGYTYSLAVGGTYAGYDTGADGNIGGAGLMIDGDLGLTVSDGGGLGVFARFNQFTDPNGYDSRAGHAYSTFDNDVQLGLRAFVLPEHRLRIALGLGVLVHHLGYSDVGDTELDLGVAGQLGASFEVVRVGTFTFELGADVSVGIHSLPDTSDVGVMGALAVWVAVRRFDPK